MRCLITLREESITISIGINITDNILKKFIDLKEEKCSTKNGTWETRALTRYSSDSFRSRTTKVVYYWEKTTTAKDQILHFWYDFTTDVLFRGISQYSNSYFHSVMPDVSEFLSLNVSTNWASLLHIRAIMVITNLNR